MLQGIASAVVVLIGLYLALVAQTAPEMQLFGWILTVVGLSGFAAAAYVRRRRQGG